MATQTRNRTQSSTRRKPTAGKPAQRRNGAAAAPVQINTEDIAQLEAGRMLVVQELGEAHAAEAALLTTLSAHITMTPQGPYRRRLERHLKETKDHSQRLQDRLTELGANRSVLAAGFGAAQTVIGQALALSKGPIDVLRGRVGEEKLFKNAKDECATEAQEIATYDGIEATARAVGDVKTAELAVSIRGEEEQMLSDLRELLPDLARATVRSIAAGDASYDVRTTGAGEAVRAMRDEVTEEASELRDDAKGAARKTRKTAKRTTNTAKRTTRRTAEKAAAKA